MYNYNHADIQTQVPRHTPQRTAILLLNTGSPRELTVSSVAEYLTLFLTDPRIIGLPKPLREALVRGFIVPFRAPKSLRRYQHVWSDEGALLRILTHSLEQRIGALWGGVVRSAMRYESGSTEAALREIVSAGCKQVVLLSLFPHYAISSFESAIVQVRDLVRQEQLPLDLYCTPPYYAHPRYVELLVRSIAPLIKDETDYLLFSYHGIPISQVKPYAGDLLRDYPQQCEATTQAVLAHPQIQAFGGQYGHTYQSRFGFSKWLAPATIDRLRDLPGRGVSSVAVVCPSFVCDCLETVEEIGVEAQQAFVRSGGVRLRLAPSVAKDEAAAESLLAIALETAIPIGDLITFAPDL